MSTEATSRPVGGSEYSWCRAVPGGTGITVLALLFSKPLNLPTLQSAIHKLQNAHPILRSKLHSDYSTNSFSFVTPATSSLQVQAFDLTSTTQSFHLTVEHEMNINAWTMPDPPTVTDVDVMFASVYSLPEDKWAVVIRLHTGASDRASSAYLLRELLGLLGEGMEREILREEGVGLPMEDYLPPEKARKPFWARGLDMLGYSVNAFRFSNLEFMEIGIPNSSGFVRLRMGSDDTDRILSGCKSRGIKLCGLLAAAGFIAARASKDLPDETWEKYSVATLIDCRSVLDPVLTDHHVGFYHSAILNSHDIKGGEDLWEVAGRVYTSLSNAMNNNKHLTDMSDLNFLMCKAIDNPGLTPSSTLRTSVLSVFEDPLIEHSNLFHHDIGLMDCIGCASIHGVSPSLSIFDTIRDGELDCACVYPSPTHSREQMQDLVNHMKQLLMEAC